MNYFKDDDALRTVALQPSEPITDLPSDGTVLGRLSSIGRRRYSYV